MVAATHLVDWLPVVAAGLIAIGALVGIRLDNRYQSRREHERWLADRRLDAYSALATASFSLGHMTVTRAQIAANYHADAGWLSIYQHVQGLWEKHQDDAVAAQNRALLVSEKSVYTRIVEMNELTRQMVDASVRAGDQTDPVGAVVGPPDAGALAELDALAEQLITVRNAFLHDAWRAIHAPAQPRKWWQHG